MEAELDATLGYEKNHKGDLQTDNKRGCKWLILNRLRINLHFYTIMTCNEIFDPEHPDTFLNRYKILISKNTLQHTPIY